MGLFNKRDRRPSLEEQEMDLALAAAFFLGGNHSSNLDPNTQAMYDDLRQLVEYFAFDGDGIGGKLNQLSGRIPPDPAYDVFAGLIRPAMRNNSEFVEGAWKILKHNRMIMRRMSNGPWVQGVDV